MADCSKIRIQLRDGAIYASKQGDIIRARGVRYAKATRFQPPQPIEPWTDIVDCTSPASICPQMPSRLEALNGPITTGHAMSEDCLHVSVCAPATNLPETTPKTLLPVIAFLHGGGYTSGGGDLDVYSGADLAAAGGVVHVGITYRLGILGYQPIQGAAPGNLGLLDQMAALRWIRDNVSSFGGDAQQVTLAGASAGADSIYCLFAADGGGGGESSLFQRAILQSAPLGVRRMDRGAMVEALDSAAQDALGACCPAETATTPDELLQVQKKLALASRSFEALLMPFAPTLGHAPLCISESEFTARVQRALTRIPLFIGYCRDEGVAFEVIFNGIHPDARPAIPTTASVVDFISRSWFQDDADRLWEQARDAGGDPWFYEMAVAPAESPFKAAHTMEMAFILGGWDAWKDAPMLKGDDGEALVKNVGAEVKKLWVAFARGEDLGRTRFRIDEHFQI